MVRKIGYFTARDGKKLRFLRADPPGNPRKVLVLLNGRSEFLEKYREVIDELLSRNYTVLSMDWRGQGLSVRELPNPQKGYVRSFDDYLSDLELFFETRVHPLELPVHLLAHSMGGHMALRFMAKFPGLVKRAVLVSPMIDIHTDPFPRFAAEIIAEFACSWGMGRSYVFGGSDYYPGKIKFKTNRLTHDPRRFQWEGMAIEANPALALGDVTFGWLKAAFDSIDELRSPGLASRITTPVLILGAGRDRVVRNDAQEEFARLLPGCTRVVIPGAFHEILHETDAVRKRFWNYFDGFMAGKY